MGRERVQAVFCLNHGVLTVVVNVVVSQHNINIIAVLVSNKEVGERGAVGDELFSSLSV